LWQILVLFGASDKSHISAAFGVAYAESGRRADRAIACGDGVQGEII
jgi:hypothetical protein